MPTSKLSKLNVNRACRSFVCWAASLNLPPDQCPSWTAGAGAPTAAEPNGSTYARTDGAGNTTLYLRASGSWVAVTLSDLSANTAAILAQVDMLAVATIAVADAPGGATTALTTVQLYQSDAVTPLTSARQVMILSGAAQYTPRAALNGNTTFDTVTAGTIVASGSGWALVTTDATGLFACTANNAADEAVYFWVASAEADDAPAERCAVISSNSDLATWAA